MVAAVTKAFGPKFPIGARVRVKAYVMDPDFPDLPLGGWVGEVVESQKLWATTCYLLRWTPETLETVHPVYRHRCQRSDLHFDLIWLVEPDLEQDAGGPLSIVWPPRPKRTIRTGRRAKTRRPTAAAIDARYPAVELAPRWAPAKKGLTVKKRPHGSKTVLQLAGLLRSQDIADLLQKYLSVEGPVVLELSNLQSADLAGVKILLELAALGTEIRGASPFIAFLLSNKP